jgi:hypothetical protein
LGWVDGRNLRIDYRWAAGDVGRIETPFSALLVKEHVAKRDGSFHLGSFNGEAMGG